MSTPWIEAWHGALYGPDGLYVRDAPHAHFSTATSPGLVDVLAEVVVSVMRRHGLVQLVDVAAGGGELASAVCDLAPDLVVTCVEVRPRPPGLDPRVDWVRSPGGAALPDTLHSLRGVLVLAHEWLDNVPCVIAERTDDGLREVCVAPDGTESLGPLVSAADRDWADLWWPPVGVASADDPYSPVEGWESTAPQPPSALRGGKAPTSSQNLDDMPPLDRGGRESAAPQSPQRLEIGRARDDAWADLCSRVSDGLAVAVDYGHLREARPEGGSLVAYRSGNVVVPVPDGTCDLTAHVAVDSLAHDRLLTQRELFHELGVAAGAPDHALARTNPGEYLRSLARRSTVGALTDPSGLGAFWWAFRRCDIG